MASFIRFTGARRAGMESVPVAATRVRELIGSLRALFARELRWFVVDLAHRRLALFTAAPLENVLIVSGLKRPSDIVPGAATHRATLVATNQGAEVVHLTVDFSLLLQAANAGLTIALAVKEKAFDRPADMSALAADVLGVLIQALDLDAARATPGGRADSSRLSHRARVGWMTFLPRKLAPLPPLPAPCTCTDLGQHGWIVRAQAGLPEGADQDYDNALAYVRHALGARVLLDGPSFPPPLVVEKLPEPEVVSPAPVATPQVPSYLHAPSVSPVKPPVPIAPALVGPVPAPQSPVPVLPPVSAAMPYPTETGDVDISKILKGSLPFDAQAASTLPVGAPAAKASPVGFGGTEEFDLAALLKAAPSVPFERPIQSTQSTQSTQPTQSAKTTALPAAPASPAPSSTHGRWIRFNPQTGEPLATPYWEELPPTDRK